MPVELIDLDRARQNLPSSANVDEPLISTFIEGASKAVQRYCRRDFVKTAYDELYNGNGDRRLILRQYPIISVESVRYRPVTVLKVINNDKSTNQQARVSVTSTGLTFVRVASGVSSTDTTITFTANPTISTLVTAIIALGNGWSAQAVGDYGPWPSPDLRTPQGALTAWGQFAELKMHTYELAGYQIADRQGWLLRAIPYTDPELLHPEDLIWPVGINNFRVQYTAGYATIPEDLQEAVAELVATWFQQKGQNLNLTHETLAGTFSYDRLTAAQIPPVIQAILKPYRRHRVHISEG